MRLSLRSILWTLTILVLLLSCSREEKKQSYLPSWNEGPAKQAIVQFVKKTTDKNSPDFFPEEERIATFDLDGTLWVEQPIYSQITYCIDRLPSLLLERPELKEIEPFKTAVTGNLEAISKLTTSDLNKIQIATLTGMSTDQFQVDVKKWLSTAKDRRWNRPYTQLAYQPMLELLNYLRENGFKTYIVTGSNQDFVRVFAEQLYGIPPEQVVGTVFGTKYGYDANGTPILTKEPALLFDVNFAGKPEEIHLIIGSRPKAAFGNSTGDRQMLEYTTAGKGAHFAMLVLHDDADREYAYGPAQELPNSRVGTFTQALYDEAVKKNWIIISMKKDWNRIFQFDEK